MNSQVRRHIEATARSYLDAFPVLLIEGARQVGKSTLAQMLAPDAQVLNLDVPAIADAVRADAMGVLAADPDKTIIVDEIQHAPELTSAIKATVDQNRRPGRFILTGSASLLRVRGSADSLAGRISRLNLYGFSQGEMNGVPDDFVARVLEGGGLAAFRSDLTRADYIDMIARGSYPPAVTLEPRLRRTWLRDYVQSIIHRDLGDLRREVQPHRADSILTVLAAQQSNELVKAHLAERTSIPTSSVTGYLDLLRDVQLIDLVKPWTPNLTKREIGRHKSVVLDSAVALERSGTTARQLHDLLYQEAFGRFLEGFVAAELLRQRGWSEVDFDVLHYRESKGSEVDVILETDDGQVIAIEVKAAASYSGRQFSSLTQLRDQLRDRFVAGIVLGTAPTGYRYAPKLWGLPISALWQLGNPA